MIKVRWTGAAGIEFVTDQGIFFIDPYLSRLGKFQALFQKVSANTHVLDKYVESITTKLSGIIAGHTHFDHALDVPYLAQASDCKVVGSKSLESLFSMHGIKDRVSVCKDNKSVELGKNISVTMISSVHGKVIMGRVPFPGQIDSNSELPMKARGYRHGDVFIPKITIDGTTFMHLGSANFVESQLDGHTCDVLFMSVPGWKRKFGYTSRLLDIVQPEVIIPFHFDDFSRPIPETGKTPILPFQGIPEFVAQIRKHAPMVKIIFPAINTGFENELF